MSEAKEMYSGGYVPPSERHKPLVNNINRGEYMPVGAFDPRDEGGLLFDRDDRVQYVPSGRLRSESHVQPLLLHGMNSEVSPDEARTFGVEIEQFIVDPDSGRPLPAREYNPGSEFADQKTGEAPLFKSASTTPEMIRDLDERGFAPMPLNDMERAMEADIADNVTGFYEDGAAVNAFAMTPEEITEERLEQHPYVQDILAGNPDYAKYFKGAGIQFHRAIRRHGETREQALEFAAFVSNRMGAYSWAFQALSGASPNLAGVDVAEHYGNSERFTKEEKQELHRLCGQTAVHGHSLRTLGRYAGSPSGGIQREPLPESSYGMLQTMHDKLRSGEISTPARVTGEHPDIRIRSDIGMHGTFETSVPDTNFRSERNGAMMEMFDKVIDSLHETWKSGDNKAVYGDQLLRDAGEVTPEDLQRDRNNSFAAAIHGMDAMIELADGTKQPARDVLQRAIGGDERFSDRTKQEITVATSPIEPARLSRDEQGNYAYANYFEGNAPGLSELYALRMEQQRYNGEKLETIQNREIVMGAAALAQYGYELKKKGSYAG